MLGALNTAQSGLQVSKNQVENVMNNLANENTAGYKTRTVNSAEFMQNELGIGQGAYVDNVSRATSVYMYQNLISEEGKNSALDELNIMLEDIESIFYETKDSGLSADLNRYFNSLENLRTNPENPIYKSDVANNANVLITSLQTLYGEIEQREDTTIGNAKIHVGEINTILKNIGDISYEIENTVADRHDLLDKRDALEKELANYIDVEISRENSYELKIGGFTAIKHNANVHKINLIEDYTAQKDVYTKENVPGHVSSLVEPTTWDNADLTSEVQTVNVTGTSTAQVSFLGTSITGSVAGDTPEVTIDKIVADKVNIIAKWNAAYPEKEISDITKTAAGELTVTYLTSEGDVSRLDQASSEGITFLTSTETTKGVADSLTYKLNNELSVTVTVGETIVDITGAAIDLNNDGSIDAADAVDKDNIVRALAYKINQNEEMSKIVTAYNGHYNIDSSGNKIFLDQTVDNYLMIEATVQGEKGGFVGEVIVNDKSAGYTYDHDDNTSTAEISLLRKSVEKNSLTSKAAINDIHVEINDTEMSLSGGSLLSMIDNLKTESTNNKFLDYKKQLDQFAKQLSDLSSAYIEKEDGTFVSGIQAVTYNDNYDQRVELGLFTGASVNSLKFDASMLNTLNQENLDYLATIQWKDDIDFDETGDNKTSFYTFFQQLRSDIASDRETVRFRLESQEAVTESLQLNYDKITKVDSDNEMIELIKFQSAYEANAKMVTVVDEMLQTLLGMKR